MAKGTLPLRGPAQFTEFTYGFAATFEIVQRLGGVSGLRAAPLFPSLTAEADLGFDARVRSWLTLYLQFKLPTRLVGARASQRPHFRAPYLRFPVKTDLTTNGKVQHNVLCDLQLSGRLVYYVAPAFIEDVALDRHLANTTLTDNSLFAPPSLLGHVPAGKRHTYCYATPAWVQAFSTPGEPERATFEELLRSAMDHESDRMSLDQHLRQEQATLVDLGAAASDYEGPRSVATAAASLDLQAVLVGKRERTAPRLGRGRR